MLQPVKDFVAERNWPTEGGLRWLIFNAKDNGFSKCVVRIGRRVLIDTEEFDRFMESNRVRKHNVSENPDKSSQAPDQNAEQSIPAPDQLFTKTPRMQLEELNAENVELKAENQQLRSALRRVRKAMLGVNI